MERPHMRSRSRDCLVGPDLHLLVLAACHCTALRNLVVALEDTGARPGELTAAEGKDWNEELRAVVYYGDDRRRQDEFRHKNARHRKDRIVRFTGEALDIARAAVARGPNTPLFPSLRGTKYAPKSVQNSFRHLRDRLGVRGLTAYSYRHTFATNWLLAGKGIDVLAELLGNSPETIRKHYAHLCQRQDSIRSQLEEFRSSGGRR
jgi:integrase